MVANRVNQIPIVQDGMLVGMLSRGDIMRYPHLGHELHRHGPALASASLGPCPALPTGKLACSTPHNRARGELAWVP
jgi:hypothetical protein